MSVGQADAKPFPRWAVAFVALSIYLISGQATPVMSRTGRSVSGHDVSESDRIRIPECQIGLRRIGLRGGWRVGLGVGSERGIS
jgi:hypothetical protein